MYCRTKFNLSPIMYSWRKWPINMESAVSTSKYPTYCNIFTDVYRFSNCITVRPIQNISRSLLSAERPTLLTLRGFLSTRSRFLSQRDVLLFDWCGRYNDALLTLITLRYARLASRCDPHQGADVDATDGDLLYWPCLSSCVFLYIQAFDWGPFRRQNNKVINRRPGDLVPV